MTDIAYYQRRLAEELAAIGRAHCPKAAAAHREMATLYQIMLDSDDGPKVIELRPEAQLPAGAHGAT